MRSVSTPASDSSSEMRKTKGPLKGNASVAAVSRIQTALINTRLRNLAVRHAKTRLNPTPATSDIQAPRENDKTNAVTPRMDASLIGSWSLLWAPNIQNASPKERTAAA